MTNRMMVSDSNVKSMELFARIYRACKCGCPNPEPHPQGLGLPTPWESCPRCGKVAVVEEQGVIAGWHRNRFIRAWRTFQIARRKEGLWLALAGWYLLKYQKSIWLRLTIHLMVFVLIWVLGWAIWCGVKSWVMYSSVLDY